MANIAKNACCILWLILSAGCSSDAVESLSGPQSDFKGDFIAVPAAYALRASHDVDLRANEGTFYLAIRRSALSQKYLVSVFLKELFPLFTPASHVVDTRLVSFLEQNGRLLMLDVDGRKKSSMEFDPKVALESYRVVDDDYAPEGDATSSFVLIDPASGLNHFGFLETALSVSQEEGGKFATDLAFAERFRALERGFQFDQVFAGHFEQPFAGNDGSVEESRLSLHGTIAVSFERKEDAGTAFEERPAAPYFFASRPRIVANSARVVQSAVHWQLEPGTRIRWLISPRLAALQEDPRYAQYDLVGAVKRGIENWNVAFGARVLEAALASEDDDHEAGDRDVNILVVDEDPEFAVAFSDWVEDPDEGRIHSANIYINAGWIDRAQSLFDPEALDAGRREALTAQIERTSAMIARQRAVTGPGRGPELRQIGAAYTARMEEEEATPREARSPQEQVEAYLTHIILHEVGHTLGLRHNFAASLLPGSSVMDYADEFDAVALTEPGPYDVAALSLLYGSSTSAPAFPFCSDEDVARDPACAPFDWGRDPLVDTHAGGYEFYKNQYLTGAREWGEPGASYLTGVISFLAAGVASDRLRAWQIASAGLSTDHAEWPSDADAPYAARADVLMRGVWQQLFFADPEPDHPQRLPFDAALRERIYTELSKELCNEDGIRSFETRRLLVDILAAEQNVQAYEALSTARAMIDAQHASANAEALLLTQDLRARIDRAITPYFH